MVAVRQRGLLIRFLLSNRKLISAGFTYKGLLALGLFIRHLQKWRDRVGRRNSDGDWPPRYCKSCHVHTHECCANRGRLTAFFGLRMQQRRQCRMGSRTFFNNLSCLAWQPSFLSECLRRCCLVTDTLFSEEAMQGESRSSFERLNTRLSAALKLQAAFTVVLRQRMSCFSGGAISMHSTQELC